MNGGLYTNMKCYIITLSAISGDYFNSTCIFSSLDNVLATRYFINYTSNYRRLKIASAELFKQCFKELADLDVSSVSSRMFKLRIGPNHIDINFFYQRNYRILITLDSSVVAFS